MLISNSLYGDGKQRPQEEQSKTPQTDREAVLATMERYIKTGRLPEHQARLEPIVGRMRAGERLSMGELEYLRKANPELYARAMRIVVEREEYKKQLEQCRSKQEAKQTHSSRMMNLVQQAQAAVNNGLTVDQRVEQLEEIQMRTSALDREYGEYSTTLRYQKLPEFRKEAGQTVVKTAGEVQVDQLRKRLSQLLSQARGERHLKPTEEKKCRRRGQWRA